MMRKFASVISLSVILFSTASFAAPQQPTTEELMAKIELLQQQLNELKTQFAESQKVQKVAAPTQQAAFTVSKGNEVEEDHTPYVGIGSKGLEIKTPDNKYAMKIKGFVQADARTYTDNGSNPSQMLLRSTRLSVETKLPGGFSTKITPDFSNQTLPDAYLDWHGSDRLNLRAGKFKSPVGLERWQSETETMFAERSLTTNLVPNRDIGVMMFGEMFGESFEYQLALTNGVADGVLGTTDTSGGKDVVGRIFTHPFRNSDVEDLKGLGIGLAGSTGQRDGTAAVTELTTGYRTTAQNNFFTYSAGTFADGQTRRVNPQAWYYNGPFGLITEYIKVTNDVTNGGTSDSLTHDSWLVSASYVLTGEDASFEGVVPEEEFAPEKDKWGAFEIAGRVARLDIDDATFPTFATAATSATSIEEKVVGLNWYMNQSVRLTFNYAMNSFDGGAAAGADREDEDVIIARAQFKF